MNSWANEIDRLMKKLVRQVDKIHLNSKLRPNVLQQDVLSYGNIKG